MAHAIWADHHASIVTNGNTVIHGDFAKLSAPTLLMMAGKGYVISEEDRREIRTLFPKIHISGVPNSGHMIPWDDFDGFFHTFGNFLGTILHPAGEK